MPLVPHGFPDWYRLSGRADETFLNVTEVNVNGLVQYGPFFVGTHQALGLELITSLRNVEFVFRYSDSAGGTTLMEQRIGVNQSCRFNGSIPISGPWVTVQAEFSVGPVSFTARMWSAQVAAMASDFTADANVLFDWENVSVPASSTVDTVITRVWPGEATWFARSDATTWIVRIHTIRETGGLRLVDRKTQTDPQDRRILFLPPQTIRVQVQNVDAVDRFFWISLAARPMWLGA